MSDDSEIFHDLGLDNGTEDHGPSEIEDFLDQLDDAEYARLLLDENLDPEIRAVMETQSKVSFDDV